MALTTRLKLDLGVFAEQWGTGDSRPAQRGTVTARELSVAVSNLTRAAAFPQMEIAAGQTRSVELGSIADARLVYVETAGTVKVRLGAIDGEAITVAPLADGTPGVLLKTGSFSGVWLTNEGSAALVVAVAAVGLED